MKLTPAQKQYLDIKAKYPDTILFFRMGDFYETFYNDAKICAKVLDIALTTRDKNSTNPIPMAWIPHHAIDKYIPKLLEANYKIAIAEQVWEVIPWKVVERKVTQVITPWTYVKETKNENNILALISEKGIYYIAYSDISTGVFHIQEIDNIDELKDILFKISPKEFILPLDIENKEEIEDYIWKFLNPLITHRTVPYEYKDLIKQFTKASRFDSFWKSLDKKAKQKVLGMFLDYIQNLNINVNILKIKFEEKLEHIYFDMLTIKNLEIIQSSYDQDKKHSLLAVLDHTITSSWARLLKNWLLHPTKNLNKISYRQEWFTYFIDKIKWWISGETIWKIKKLLNEVYDIERIFYLINFKQNSPFHWLKLKISLNAIKKIQEIDNKYIQIPPELKKILEILDKWLKDNWFTLEKDFIQDWFSQKVDKLRKIAYHSDQLLIDYQQEISQKFQILVKIKYVKNQGYLIEVSKKDVKKFEEQMKNFLNSQTFSEQDSQKFSFLRKQTLKIAERYVSPYLKQLEEKILSATYELQEKEKEILEQWKDILYWLGSQIEALAKKVWEIDIFINLWKFFKENNYIKPEIGWEIKIIWGRHPVIEKFLPVEESFIENDLIFRDNKKWNKELSEDKDIIHIITWPNMWWKSTYLRQNALILLLAHCWLFVPAKSCQTPVLSWIFARVGSWDVLVKNQSTFMTEMIEVANILNNSDKNSFIIFDELGRWTSTYDGMAISQAVIEYIVEKLKAKTLFATHYHELIKLEEKYPWKVKNFSVAVYENNWQIVFMKKIVPWWANKSYGIHVAELAGLPKEIIENANKNLKDLENKKRKIKVKSLWDDIGWFTQEISEKDKQKLKNFEQLKEIFDNIDVYNTTPIDALKILEEVKKQLK